ncbi:hypothetical protein LWI29_007353 [Acer saccharum]|uniref:Uncharacterized protein n=1 Tax=Acer saccharum TaxID=4024 RepID=A0AA39SK32_ACESA|nr:hypothetical protein LWI29_007353 [Acer saccharum]
MVYDIRQLLLSRSNFSIKFTPRRLNSLADSLAKADVGSNGESSSKPESAREGPDPHSRSQSRGPQQGYRPVNKQVQIISQDDTDGFTTHIETDSDADHVVHNWDNDQHDTRGMSQNVGTLNTEALVDNPDPKEVDNMQLLVLEEQGRAARLRGSFRLRKIFLFWFRNCQRRLPYQYIFLQLLQQFWKKKLEITLSMIGLLPIQSLLIWEAVILGIQVTTSQ